MATGETLVHAQDLLAGDIVQRRLEGGGYTDIYQIKKVQIHRDWRDNRPLSILVDVRHFENRKLTWMIFPDPQRPVAIRRQS